MVITNSRPKKTGLTNDRAGVDLDKHWRTLSFQCRRRAHNMDTPFCDSILENRELSVVYDAYDPSHSESQIAIRRNQRYSAARPSWQSCKLSS